jgi:hypothetical protein
VKVTLNPLMARGSRARPKPGTLPPIKAIGMLLTGRPKKTSN